VTVERLPPRPTETRKRDDEQSEVIERHRLDQPYFFAVLLRAGRVLSSGGQQSSCNDAENYLFSVPAIPTVF
jgi:hypothetical protein